MDRKIVNELAITIEKINYLYRNIRKRDEDIQKIELALLKKYVSELYDGLISLDKSSADSLTTNAPVKQEKPQKVDKPVKEAIVEAVAAPVIATTESTANSNYQNEIYIFVSLIKKKNMKKIYLSAILIGLTSTVGFSQVQSVQKQKVHQIEI